MQTFTIKHRGYQQTISAASPFAANLAAKSLKANLDKVIDAEVAKQNAEPGAAEHGIPLMDAMRDLDKAAAEYGWAPAVYAA